LLVLLSLVVLVLSMFSVPLVMAVEDSWVSKASMNEARAYLGIAVVNGKIYAIGGDKGSLTGNAMNAIGMTRETTKTNEEYTPSLDEWVLKSPMPTARARFGCVVYQNRIYCIGGYSATVSNETHYFDLEENEVYDPVTDTWETKTPLPTPRHSPATSIVNGKIYVIGGYSISTHSIFNLCEVYDTASDTWATMSPPPLEVSSASVALDNKIYTLGQNSDAWETFIQVYDTATDNWTIKGSAPTSAFASATSTGSSDAQRIYFFDENRTDVYNPNDDSWTEGNPAPTPRPIAAATVIDDLIYLVGGRTGQWGYMTFMYPSALCEQYTPIGYIPEFPSWIVLPLFFVVTLVGVAAKRKFFR
jgi:hypothetical protein